MAAGIAFVVLLVVGVLVSFANSPDIKSKDDDAATSAKYVHALSSHTHRTGILIGAYLVLLAALAFVWYTQGLRARLDDVAGSRAAGRRVAALGVLGAGALTAAAMANAVMAGAVEFGGDKVPRDGDTMRVVMDMFFPFIFVVFALTSVAIIATLAVHARAAGLPSWLGYAAWLAAVGGILAVIFLPMVLVLLWYLAVAIAGVSRPAVSAGSAAPA